MSARASTRKLKYLCAGACVSAWRLFAVLTSSKLPFRCQKHFQFKPIFEPRKKSNRMQNLSTFSEVEKKALVFFQVVREKKKQSQICLWKKKQSQNFFDWNFSQKVSFLHENCFTDNFEVEIALSWGVGPEIHVFSSVISKNHNYCQYLTFFAISGMKNEKLQNRKKHVQLTKVRFLNPATSK